MKALRSWAELCLVARRQLCFLVIFLGAGMPALAADRYTFDELHSIAQFEFSHLGVTTQTGRFDKVKGTVYVDFAKRSGSVIYEVETASLNMGYGTETPDSAGYRLFNVVKFPVIRFKSTKLIFNAQKEIIAADGTLTMLGVSKPLRVNVNNFKCAISPVNRLNTCACDVSATLIRSDFGMIQYLPGISDEIRVNVPVEAIKN